MIRVLRVLEYEYESHAAYEHDKAQWTHELNIEPTNLSKSQAKKRMVSQVVRVQEIEENDDE